MPQIKYKITIKNSAVDDKIHFFTTSQRCADFLEISLNTFYALRNNKLKMVHNDTKKLKGIIVERLPVFYYYKPNSDVIKENERINNEYKRKILEK